jgi:hypothetical protein
MNLDLSKQWLTIAGSAISILISTITGVQAYGRIKEIKSANGDSK